MKKFLLAVPLFLLFISSFAQMRISGIVMDETGNPVPFANVIFTGSSEGTTTAENGQFYLESLKTFNSAEFSFLGYQRELVLLKPGNNLDLKVVLKEDTESLSEVYIYQGKTSKKDNPAIDILRKIWKNKRTNGVKKFDQYSFRKYEKLQFDINSIDSTFVNSRIFNGMEFIFDDLDTNSLTGKNYLPVFINESVSQVYGDNKMNKKREVLQGNKNSGFGNSQVMIAGVKDLYQEFNIYDNYLKIFDKSFISPLSTTGINNYNYVLADSSFIENRWCYKIIFYPRRQNELTMKGDFWVNDTTWAIKKIKMEMGKNANINWINGIYAEQDFEVLNDSVFLISRDFFMADFALRKKEDARGIYGKRTVLYDNYKFDEEKDSKFYDIVPKEFQDTLYNRSDTFWQQNRLEPLSRDEGGIYKMLDTLQNVKAFQRVFTLASIAATGYIEYPGFDFGPIYSSVGFNQVEGWRIRAGGRTYFGQDDPWRIKGYGAYGFKDDQFKYGILTKLMLNRDVRLIASLGTRRDIEQLGASLTNSVDVLGRSLASSSLINVGDNDKLSSISLTTAGLEMEPVLNFTVRLNGSYRNLKAASPTFSLAWYTNDERTQIKPDIDQGEISTIFTYTPGRKTTGFGVDRLVINAEDFPTFFLNYSIGSKDFFHSDFNYQKVQFFYNQPWWIGGFGLANLSMEAGKTFGEVPLGLLNVVPGNQTYFALYNTFPLLNFYEFVTDTYVSAHFQHNFNGRLFSRIPGLRKLNLRELVGIRGVWGQISEENKLLDASGIPLLAPNEEPYYEYSVGIGNIFKFIRIDAHFRGNYFEVPEARTFGVTAAFGFHF